MSLTLHDLKSHLWNCAEILRGSAVDRTDWKAYILPLLFFKRICDVWDEETAEAVELFGDVGPVDFPEVHRFVVPEGCHWQDVREAPANVGAALSYAMRETSRIAPRSSASTTSRLRTGPSTSLVTSSRPSARRSRCCPRPSPPSS